MPRPAPPMRSGMATAGSPPATSFDQSSASYQVSARSSASRRSWLTPPEKIWRARSRTDSWVSERAKSMLVPCARGPEERQHELRIDLRELDLHRHADLHVAGRDADEVRDEPRALLQLDQHDRVRVREGGDRRVVRDDEGEDAAAPAGALRVPLERVAVRARRPGRMAELAAALAALDEELAALDAFPEEGVVVRARRPRNPAPARRRLRGGLRRVGRGGDGPRLELEDAEAHARHLLAVLVAVGHHLVDEAARAERRLLLLGDGLDARRDGDAIAGPQIAAVLLAAVRRDDRGVAGG